MCEIFVLPLQAQFESGKRKDIYVTKNGRFL